MLVSKMIGLIMSVGGTQSKFSPLLDGPLFPDFPRVFGKTERADQSASASHSRLVRESYTRFAFQRSTLAVLDKTILGKEGSDGKKGQNDGLLRARKNVRLYTAPRPSARINEASMATPTSPKKDVFGKGAKNGTHAPNASADGRLCPTASRLVASATTSPSDDLIWLGSVGWGAVWSGKVM